MKPFKGLVIKTGSEPPAVVTFTTFEQVQEAVGGCVDHFELDVVTRKQLGVGRVDVLVNDEGKDVLPVNAEATKLCANGMFWGDHVCGTVVLAGERNGTWLDVPEKLVAAMEGRYHALSAHEQAKRIMESGNVDFVIVSE